MTPEAVFLALMGWREARGEGAPGIIAVMYTAIERAKVGGWWGNTIVRVIFKPWQYSSLTAKNDPELILWPDEADPSWQECLTLAQAAIAGTTANPAPRADSYFDTSITAPAWATPDKFIVQLGRLKFYRVSK